MVSAITASAKANAAQRQWPNAIGRAMPLLPPVTV